MASRYSIETIFSLLDKYTAPLSKITRSTKTFTQSVKADFAKAQRQVRDFGRNFKRNLGRNIVIGIGIATAAITKLTIEASKAWDIQAAAVKNVESGIKSTSGIAGRSLSELENQAKSLQANTFIGDEKILQGVTAQILTFTNITESRFDRTQQAALDVTSKLNGLNVTSENLKSTSIALGKAINAPTANLGALGRMGIQFSDSQKKVIKSLEATGQLTKAQELILDELERQYGGTAAALAKTAGGMQLSTKNMAGDMLELIGKGIEPLRLKFFQFINGILPKLLPHVEKFTNFIENNADAIFKTFVDTISTVWDIAKTGINILSTLYNILKPFEPLLGGIIAAFLTYKIGMLAAAVATSIFNAVTAANPVGLVIVAIGILIGLIVIMVQNWEIASKWIGIVTVALGLLFFVMSANPIGLVIAAIGALIAIGVLVVDNWKSISEWLGKVWDWIVKLSISIWDGLVNAFKVAGEWIANVGEKFTFILGPIGFLISAFIEIGKNWDKISEKFKGGDILGGILAIGGAIVSGLLAPVQGFLELVSKIPGVGNLAKGAAEKIQELRFGLTGEKKENQRLAPVTPSERSSLIREEKNSSGELIIRDETGRAKLGKRDEKSGYKIKLQSSGVFF